MKTSKIVTFKIIPFILTVLFLFPFAFAQNEFEQWKSMELDSFQKYKDERDGEFIKFLKQQWKEYDITKGSKRDETPKPIDIPVAPVQPPSKEIEPSKKIVKEISVPKYIPPVGKIITPEAPPEVKQKGKVLNITFYQTPVKIYYDPAFYMEPIGTVDQKTISSFWDKMSRADYDSFVKQARQLEGELKLNDWGYHHLLYDIGEKIYRGNRNMTFLFVWYISSKSGYDSRVGYKDNRVYILLPSKNSVYGIPFLTLEGKKYYALSFKKKPETFSALYTYKGKYPNADKLMDYRIADSPGIKQNSNQRDLKFKYKGKSYHITIRYNNNLVDYYKYYPQTDIEIFFDALPSKETEYTVLKELKPLVEGKSETEAVTILLRFVQTAFEYKTDDEQFGGEKYMMPEEMLYYPYSDCEDRSVFFAYLVRKLLGLEVVGLDYPGHISTAVRIDGKVYGDYVYRKNTRYTVCDPTYINAGIGMAIPKFKKFKPKVVEISSLND